MSDTLKPYSMITDFVTGKDIPNVGAEENRQMVEQFLVREKGYSKEDIAVDVDLAITIGGETYRSQIDLVVSADGGYGPTHLMAIKCAAASLGSLFQLYPTARPPLFWIRFRAKSGGKD
jgi:hypothetical protein